MSSLLENLNATRRRLSEACRRAGRRDDEVELIAVTKYATVDQVKEAIVSGKVGSVAESRVKDGVERKIAVGEAAADLANWRFIGHLQKNKALAAVMAFDYIDSVDSFEIAEAIQRRLEMTGKPKMPVLLQVNPAGKTTQHGIAVEEIAGLLTKLRKLERLRPEGLMAIAPMVEPVEATRPYFKTLKKALDDNFPKGSKLSMGMTRDFEIAVEEGATMVRIGSLLFGK